MAFDPAAYLGETQTADSGGFDPKKYLEETAPSQESSFDPQAYLQSQASDATKLRPLAYGPVVGEHTPATMVGPLNNELGIKDVAISPNLLKEYGGGPYRLGQVVDAHGPDGSPLGSYRVGDSSWFSPGKPTQNTIEFRDRDLTGKGTVTIQPSADQANFDLGDANFALAQPHADLQGTPLPPAETPSAAQILGQDTTGMKAPGNLDPFNRPVLHNADGTVSTTRSFSIGTDAGEVLIPRIFGGKDHSEQDAIAHFNKTGENFGTFDTPENADAYATRMHDLQAARTPPAPPEISTTPYGEGMVNAARRVTDQILSPDSRVLSPPFLSPAVAEGIIKTTSPLNTAASIIQKVTGKDIHPAMQAANSALGEALSSASVPENIAGLLTFAIPGIAETYAINVLTKMPDQYGRLKEAIQTHGLNSPQAAGAATEAGITDLMGFLAHRGAAEVKFNPEVAPGTVTAAMRGRLRATDPERLLLPTANELNIKFDGRNPDGSLNFTGKTPANGSTFRVPPDATPEHLRAIYEKVQANVRRAPTAEEQAQLDEIAKAKAAREAPPLREAPPETTPEKLPLRPRRVAQPPKGKAPKAPKVEGGLGDAFDESPLVQAIIEHGGITSATTAKKLMGPEEWARNKGEWDGAPTFKDPRHNQIYASKAVSYTTTDKKTGETKVKVKKVGAQGLAPDVMAGYLASEEAGYQIADGYTDTMWAAIQRESDSAIRTNAARRAQAKDQAAAMGEQAAQEHAFKAAIAKPEKGEVPIHATDLNIDDTVNVNGVDLKVTDIDEHTGALTLEDGKEYGVQHVEGDLVFYGKVIPEEPVAAEAPPESPFKKIAQRITNAEERFIEYAREHGGLSREQAETALANYKKAKAIKIDPVGGQFTFTHGAFGDVEMLRRAAGLEPGVAGPTRRDLTEADWKADPERAALIATAHSVEGSGARWATLRATGATDAELKAALSEEYGISGGQPGEGGITMAGYHGGENPRLELNRPSELQPTDPKWKPNVQTIKGPALIKLARRALEIPERGGRVEADVAALRERARRQRNANNIATANKIDALADSMERTAKPPQLRRGERQGDIFAASSDQPFNLAGERGTDFAARQAEADAAAQAKLDAAAAADRQQAAFDWTSATESTDELGARLKFKADKEGGFITGDLLKAAQDFGRRVYEKTKDFAAWSAEMVRNLGEGIRDRLKTIWNGLTKGHPIKQTLGIRVRSELDAATAVHGRKGQVSFAEAERAKSEILRRFPKLRDRNAISILREAGGDRRVIEDWLKTPDLPKWFKRAAGDALTLKLKPEGVALLKKIDDTYDILHGRGERAGVLTAHRDNYVTHVWDVAKKWTGIGASKLKDRFRFNKARKFETFFEGAKAGFKPTTLDIADLLPGYLHEMNKVIADRQFVSDVTDKKSTEGTPLTIPRGKGQFVDSTEYAVSKPGAKRALKVFDNKEDADAHAAGIEGAFVARRAKSTAIVNPRGFAKAVDLAGEPIDQSQYKVLDQPALHQVVYLDTDAQGNKVLMQADLAVHPELAKRLNAMIGESAFRKWYNEPSRGLAVIPKAIVKGLDTAQAVMKREMFGALAPFHQVQEGTHAIGHTVNPFFGLEDMSKPTKAHIDAMDHGLMLLPEKGAGSRYMEGVGGRNTFISQALRRFGMKAGRAAADIFDGYQDFLFHQYIPGLKFKTYEHMVERNMSRYAKELKSGEVTEGDVKQLSAEQSNAAYGHLSYALLDRNPTIQHLLQWGLLAPDFLEARGRFAGQAAKGFATKAGHEQLRAVAILAAVNAAGAYIISSLLGDKWDPKHPFEVTHGNRTYAMRSVPEDIFRLFLSGPDVAREFISARLNPFTSKLTQMRTARNYRGEKVSFTDTLEELFAGYIPLIARGIPFVRNLTTTTQNNPVSPLEQTAGSLGLRISRHSMITEAYQLARDYNEAAGKLPDTGVYPTSKYQQLRYALEDGDASRAADEYAKLKKEVINTINSKVSDKKKLSEGFHESLFKPFTGSKEGDKDFKKKLPLWDRMKVEEAERKRIDIYMRFKKIEAGKTF